MLLVAPDGWRDRTFHVAWAIFAVPFIFIGGTGLTQGLWGGVFPLLVGAVWMQIGAYRAILRRSLLLLPDVPSLVEEFSFLGVRWSRVLPSEKFSRIDIVRGKRGLFYTVQLTSDTSSARESLVDLPDLLQAEGFALYLSSALSLPAYVFDFENPRKSDRRFARDLTI